MIYYWSRFSFYVMYLTTIRNNTYEVYQTVIKNILLNIHIY